MAGTTPLWPSRGSLLRAAGARQREQEGGRRGGGGAYLDVSLLDGQVSLMGYHLVSCLLSGRVPGPAGNALPYIVPYQAFRTASVEVTVAVNNDRLWRAFAPPSSAPTSPTPVRHQRRPGTPAGGAGAAAGGPFLTQLGEAWLERLQRAGRPAGPINSVERVARHPQVQARGLLVEVDHPGGPRPHPYRAVAGRAPRRAGRAAPPPPPPLLGQHTVPRSCNVSWASAQRIADLESAGGGTAAPHQHRRRHPAPAGGTGGTGEASNTSDIRSSRRHERDDGPHRRLAGRPGDAFEGPASGAAVPDYSFEWFSGLLAYQAVNREQLWAFLRLDLPQPWQGVDVACGLGLMSELRHEVARKIGAPIQRTVCIDLDRQAFELAREKPASYPARLIQSLANACPRAAHGQLPGGGQRDPQLRRRGQGACLEEAFRVLSHNARLFNSSSTTALQEGTEHFWVEHIRRAPAGDPAGGVPAAPV